MDGTFFGIDRGARILAHAGEGGLVVPRSFIKFFRLAAGRLGVALCYNEGVDKNSHKRTAKFFKKHMK